jgi:bifunctional ADP-heptose synthase (sugar kinase/adenylyltransferase)
MTSTSRIEIALNSAQGMAKSCSLANEAAPVIVSHFPAGT